MADLACLGWWGCVSSLSAPLCIQTLTALASHTKPWELGVRARCDSIPCPGALGELQQHSIWPCKPDLASHHGPVSCNLGAVLPRDSRSSLQKTLNCSSHFAVRSVLLCHQSFCIFEVLAFLKSKIKMYLQLPSVVKFLHGT